MGATVVDPAWGTTPANNNLGVQTTGNQIDTTIPGTYTVTYTATDQAGNTATSTRAVIVTDLSVSSSTAATTTDAIASTTPSI